MVVQEIEGMLEILVDAEERTAAALKDTMRSVFHSFGEQLVASFYAFLEPVKKKYHIAVKFGEFFSLANWWEIVKLRTHKYSNMQ